MPGWLIVAVSVALTVASSAAAVIVFLQAILILAALAWLLGGRARNLALGSLLFGWAAGNLAWFNLLFLTSIGIFLLPVTLYVVVGLVLLLSARNARCAVAAGGGILLAVATQTVFLGFIARH